MPGTSELFNLYEWMFITEGLETVRNPVYIPFVENLAEKLTRAPAAPFSHSSKNAATAVSAAAAAVSASSIAEHSENEDASTQEAIGLRRPVITMRTVCIGPNDTNLFSSPWFHTFLSRFSRAAYQGGLAPNVAPDMDFIALLLAGDFSDLESEGGELSFPNATATVLDIDEFEIVDIKPKKEPTSPAAAGSEKWVNVNYKKDSDKEIAVDKGAFEKEAIIKDTHAPTHSAVGAQESARKSADEQVAKFSKPIFERSSSQNIISDQRFTKSILTDDDVMSYGSGGGSESDFTQIRPVLNAKSGGGGGEGGGRDGGFAGNVTESDST